MVVLVLGLVFNIVTSVEVLGLVFNIVTSVEVINVVVLAAHFNC